MRRGTIALALAGIALMSCEVSRTTGPIPLNDSRLEVYVHWGDNGLADRRLEILELGLERFTDEAGIAEFLLPPGTYTLRAYVTGPGPSIPPDVKVTTSRWRTTRIEIVDCLPCVAPGRNG